jgi:hypothetical protein
MQTQNTNWIVQLAHISFLNAAHSVISFIRFRMISGALVALASVSAQKQKSAVHHFKPLTIDFIGDRAALKST